MKLAITPRFYESNVEQLISIEKKYYSFFKKYNHILNLIPFEGISPADYLDTTKPESVIFAGGYRMYTKEIKNFETEVLRETLKRKIPILAICCGMWTVNAFFNGTLKFNENHQSFDGEKIDLKKMIHTVEATDLINKKIYNVNSFHSKVIDQTGKDLISFLVAEDGTIEGFYNNEKKIIGVQFHMENKGVSTDLTEQIMKKFHDFKK